jgi:glycine/D-amino acid oxidase-like deaminating enzyme
VNSCIDRRRMLSGTGAAFLVGVLDGCASRIPDVRPSETTSPILPLPPLHTTPDRITAITVCTRPFRPQGPRLDVEQIGRKTVIHNYGHGGSGWSLSWGSSSIAVEKAMATGEHQIAVIGCGALGMTSALLLQRAGAQVTIYAKDLPPNVPSSLATGVWSPDSRICFEDRATPAFKQLWERMARTSFRTYQTMLGLSGDPVEFFDGYIASDDQTSLPTPGPLAQDARPRFADLQGELLGDLTPHEEEFGPAHHPFAVRYVRRAPQMMFNLPAYTRMLMSDFLANGGRIVIDEFHTPTDFERVPAKTLIHATGYGARALFNDQSITPVRGQVAHTIPQPEIRYGLQYRTVYFVPRRDGLVFQVIGENDYYGFGDESRVPDPTEAEFAVKTIAGLCQFRGR